MQRKLQRSDSFLAPGAIGETAIVIVPSGDDSSASQSERTLPALADELERRLGMALKAYRQRAEEILDQHMDTLEKTQVHYHHEIALLKAENAKLREMIGKRDDASFPQSVFFQASAPTEQLAKKDTKNLIKKGSDDDDDKRLLKGKKGKKGDEQPGGSWQNFVAWVPNGAALSNPEPWKPLPQQSFTQGSGAGTLRLLSPPSASKGPSVMPTPITTPRTSTVNSIMPGHTSTLTMVLPGQVHESPGETYTGDDDKGSDFTKSTDEDDDDVMGTLVVYDVWKPSEKDIKKASGKQSSIDDGMSRTSSEKDEKDEDFKNVPHSIFIVNPDSGIRIAWDLAGLFMVVYDMIMIPMAVFDMPDNGFLTAMDWVTRVFWTLDMGASCCTGVILADGTVEYNPRFILKRYVKSWFGLDVIIVGSDWFGMIFSSGGMGLSKLARTSRTARIVRLLRLARMQEVVANITERVQSGQLVLLLQVIKILVVLIASCHVTACGWWGVGKSSSETSWIQNYNYNGADIGMQYLVCLHWALSQFTGGMDELRPTRAFERFYNVVVWIFAFMTGLVMLSFLTSCLTQQYIIGGSGARQMATLKTYLNQNKIPKNLIKRLCRSAKHAVSGDLQPDTVDLLTVVSEPLKIEMHYEMYSRVLQHHPFFWDFLLANNQVMRRVCHSCMSMLLLDSGDVLFRRGEEASEPKMYFVCNGTLEYMDKYGEVSPLVEKQWAAEASLWCAWRHQGTLSAISDSKIAMLDAELFMDVCSHHMKKKGQMFNPKQYAVAFVDELNKHSELTDLHNES